MALGRLWGWSGKSGTGFWGDDMTDAELKKIQKISLNMAKDFYGFCEEHGLLCYLCGGGCIGAVRNGGMIPWDDDLDFFMPRPDYEKAWRLWKKEKKHSRYVLEKPGRKLVTHDLFFKIRDRSTTYIRDYELDVAAVRGVALDVLPLDGYPGNRVSRMWQCIWAYVYSLYCAQLVPVNHGWLIQLASKVLLAAVPDRRLRYRIWCFAEKQMTKYAKEKCIGYTELCSGPRYMKNYYPRDIFEKAVIVPYEDTVMPVPQGYDRYLRTAFGDYMKLPPKEKCVPQHGAAVMDLDKSYDEWVKEHG